MAEPGQFDMEACDVGLDNRDLLLGERRCVICGIADQEYLQHCYNLFAGSDAHRMLEQMGWIPAGVKALPKHELNGLVMCPNHYQAFHDLRVFIRFQPAVSSTGSRSPTLHVAY
jgi:hypothetical protein